MTGEPAKKNGLNPSQQKIAETLDGMIVVDAGPGTGKTHTVVSRCINILSQRNFDWKDLVMLTFTRNAAAEMRERVQSTLADMLAEGGLYARRLEMLDEEGRAEVERQNRHLSEKERDLAEYERLNNLAKNITIGTFDSFCLSIVKQSPLHVSRFFGITDVLTRSANICENESFNQNYFKRFLDRFLMNKGSDFGDLAAIAADNPGEVYDLINRLMARGIVPYKKTESGKRLWFGGNEGQDLVGDTKKLREIMDDFEGLEKSEAEKFKDIPEAESFNLASKEPIPKMLDLAAFDDRTDLIDMIHEIYYDYIVRCIADDHLTFGLVACFAFIILYSDEGTRERVSTKYLIVDEFQDTNSNQLMISLMVLKEPNLCVVGDWKQGIYGFRFVSIENITEFERKAVELRRFLNDDKVRIKFSIPETIKLSLTENYRSSQLIIDKAYDSLLIPGTKADTVDVATLKTQITPIESKNKALAEHTAFECVKCDRVPDEVDEVLRRIDRYVFSDRYTIVEKEGTRKPRYGDIAILCRQTGTSRKIYEACLEKGIPAFLQGDVDIMNTREGKLLLAWLRYISNDKDPWGVTSVLADLGHSCEEIAWMVRYDKEAGSDHIPEEIKSFRKHLRSKRRRITELISDVFAWYGLDNNITQAITTVLSSTHRSSLITISDVIMAIESDMEKHARYDVDGLPDSNAVIIQTLHKSKGLEYPIVIIPGINSGSFPSSKDTDMFRFGNLTGIRCTKEIVKFNGEKKIADSWKTAVVKKSIKFDYSEERRLLFVGISRAKQYCTLIASGRASNFFSYYAGEEPQSGGVEPVPVRTAADAELIAKPEVKAFRPRRKNLAVHDIMNFNIEGYRPESDSDEVPGKGMQYGTEVHGYIELIVREISFDESAYKRYPELTKAKEIVDGLRAQGAELRAERECSLPLNDLNATVRGVIDMMAVLPDRVEIHDWKTDSRDDYEEEYKLQLSVYAHILAHFHPDKKVVCFIDWLSREEQTVFDPLPLEMIEARARDALTI
ncbi:MAG: UvrD-helicase domain-containing protein [archaeon]|nr:UvrD-helicase domain-containing protein [archaeon]